ncbi:MAG: transposase domain-containing protein [Lachnospiraceae bacterium]|nr:transposase domain-containing protein [Lachnospiraceae bacterium]
MVETAKANQINTYKYLKLLLTEIPRHMDNKDLRFLDKLIPWSPRLQNEYLSKYKTS